MRLTALLTTTALVLTSLAHGAIAEERTEWRIFVGDHAKGQVTAIDLGTDETLATFELDSPPVLYTTPSRAAVFAVQGEADKVAAISSGIAFEDHGDHADIAVSDPQLLERTIDGDKPVHFVEHHGQIALFYDGEGVGRIVSEHDWLHHPEDLEVREIATAAPHHGVVIPWGDFAIGTDPTPNADTTRPQGVFVYDADNAVTGALHDCPLLHGEATSGNITAIACADGLLLASGSGAPTITHLPYADHLGEGNSSTLLGGVGLQYFLGNWGPGKVVLIDPAEDDAFRAVELPTRRVHFAVDPQQPKYAYIFTEDGNLHRLDVVSGAIVDTLKLTEPYSMDGEWSLPRPRIAVAGSSIVVTDPLQARLHVIDASSFTKDREIAVPGMPFTVVAAGGSGTEHGEEAETPAS